MGLMIFPGKDPGRFSTPEGLKLKFDNNGFLKGDPDLLYSEITLAFQVQLPEQLPGKDLLLADAVSGTNGWQCLLTVQGHIRLVRRSDGKTILETGCAAGLLKTPQLRVEVVLNNTVWTLRFIDWASDDPQDFCRAQIFINGRKCADGNLREPDLPIVPVQLKMGTVCTFLSAYNTIHRDFFLLPDDSDGPVVDTDFPEASRAYSRYDRKNNLLHLFAGPEFVRTDSYWIFCRVATKGGLVRIYTMEYEPSPGMAPAFFRSADRKNWVSCDLLESTDESGKNRALIRLPEGTWYLASSIPFMKTEQDLLLEKYRSEPDFDVQEIGKSTLNQSIRLLRAGHGKYQIFFQFGQHSPMEMLGCHILSAILEQFRKNPELKEEFTLYAVAPVNMDAAVYGGDGWNSEGWNTNRCWFRNLQPEVMAIENFLKTSGITPNLLIDWHGGGCWRGHSILYFNESVIRKYAGDKADAFIRSQNTLLALLEQECGFRKSEHMDFPFRNCCAHDWFLIHFPEAVSITVELSITTCFNPEQGRYEKVSQENLASCGKAIVRVLRAMEEKMDSF